MSFGMSEVSGFGTGSQAEVAALSKALEAGYQVGAGKTGGSALRVESLEASLKVLTYTASHIKFWKMIPKSPAYSTVEEYTQLTDYGGSASPFIREAELPQSSDISVIRRMAMVKYCGIVREVSHQATLVTPAHGDVIALQNHGGILELLRKVEGALFTGDSSLAFSGESEQWDGLSVQIDSSMVLDLEGDAIQEADVEEATNMLLEAYAFPNLMMLNTRANSDLVKSFYPRERIALPAPQNGQVGLSVSSVMTQAGPIDLSPNIFIEQNPVPRASTTSANAPATPASVTAGAVTGTDGDFNKASTTGTTYVSYVVTACNRFGESAPTAVMGAAVTLTQANKDLGVHVPLTITNPGTIGAFHPEYFRVYRSRQLTSSTVPSSLSEYSLIAQVPASSQSASGTTTYNDVNLVLPFTSTAYIGQMDPNILTFRQLMPMMKMDLGILGPAYRWMILLYGVPILFGPKKWLKMINVGQLSVR